MSAPVGKVVDGGRKVLEALKLNEGPDAKDKTSPQKGVVEIPPLKLRFDASVKAPPFTQIFMENGGQIDAMAVRWESDMALTGSTTSTVVRFSDTKTIPVSIDIPPEALSIDEYGHITLPTNLRINVMTQRMVAAINGTLVTSLSGESSDHAFHALCSGSHYQMGQHYKTFEQYSETIAISKVRVVSLDSEGNETRVAPSFKKEDENTIDLLKAGEMLAEAYVKSGYETRQAALYEPAPMLHKTVYSEVVGINWRGYSMLHSIMNREAYLSLNTLNAMYEMAVSCDCCQDKVDIQNFLSRTDRPGLMAAMEARAVASATSLIVNVLMSYRADGVNIVAPNGARFAPVENWNGSVPRSCLEANDCDGLALMAVSLIKSTLKLTPDQLANPEYKYLRAVRNSVFPHYQLALSVIGATAAEATSADGTHSAVAGHAITVLIPTMSFLRSLSKTMDKRIGKDGPLVTAEENVEAVEKARFAALFPASAVEELPSNEKELLGSWSTARHEFTQLSAFAIEGTTPASPVLYVSNPERREKATKAAALDKKVFISASPNVFRSVKVLHVGGSSAGSTHTFYSSLIELTFGDDFPLYAYAPLRSMSAAATQFVLTPTPREDTITEAGVSPRELVMEDYAAFPLIQLNSAACHVLDVASATARKDLMPPREKGPTQLNDFQSRSLAQSMKYVEELEAMLNLRTEESEIGENHHCVAYICAFNTLVHNPDGVENFVKTMKRVAVSGVVDKKIIPGLAVNKNGEDVGVFLHVDIYAPV
jgi:hypothetical protein